MFILSLDILADIFTQNPNLSMKDNIYPFFYFFLDDYSMSSNSEAKTVLIIGGVIAFIGFLIMISGIINGKESTTLTGVLIIGGSILFDIVVAASHSPDDESREQKDYQANSSAKQETVGVQDSMTSMEKMEELNRMEEKELITEEEFEKKKKEILDKY